MSPIGFNDDEETDDEELIIAPYRQALMNDSFATERSSLLERRKGAPSARIHPLWDEKSQNKLSNKSSETTIVSAVGNFVCAISGVHLSCIALHDVYLWYISFRLGYESSISMWRLPLLAPSNQVLARFGALLPQRVILDGQWWRLASSAFVVTSVVEFFVVLGAWQTIPHHGPTATRIGSIYLGSFLVGQLWMFAFDSYGISGGVSWGTCGILCAASVGKGRALYLAILIVLFVGISLVGPGSASGTIGSMLFGAGISWVRWPPAQQNKSGWPRPAPSFVCLTVSLFVLAVPTVFLYLN